MVELAGEEEGRAHRLVGIVDLGEAHPREGGLVARQRQGLAGRCAGEGHRPADDHPGGQLGHAGVRIGPQFQEEGGEQVLEPVAPAQHLGLGEALRRREALEGLDKAGFRRVLHVGLDGPGPGRDGPVGRSLARMERQAAAKGEQLLPGGVFDAFRKQGIWRREADEMRRSSRVGQGHDRVGRPEVDAEGKAGRHLRRASQRGRAQYQLQCHPGSRVSGCPGPIDTRFRELTTDSDAYGSRSFASRKPG